jgi:hypothetical protein
MDRRNGGRECLPIQAAATNPEDMPGLNADFVVELLRVIAKSDRDSGQLFAGSQDRELPGLRTDFGTKVPGLNADLGPDC